jgi:hypothetical protein
MRLVQLSTPEDYKELDNVQRELGASEKELQDALVRHAPQDEFVAAMKREENARKRWEEYRKKRLVPLIR